MRNRDYFTRPIQSDRGLHDYGNTRLGRGSDGPALTSAAVVAGFALVAALALVIGVLS